MCIQLYPVLPEYIIAVPYETGTTDSTLAWILNAYHTTSATLTLNIKVCYFFTRKPILPKKEKPFRAMPAFEGSQIVFLIMVAMADARGML